VYRHIIHTTKRKHIAFITIEGYPFTSLAGSDNLSGKDIRWSSVSGRRKPNLLPFGIINVILRFGDKRTRVKIGGDLVACINIKIIIKRTGPCSERDIIKHNAIIYKNIN
jgi:hypothetical protein